MDYILGSLIFYKNIRAFLSWVQRKVLGIPYSHNSIYIGKNELGRMEEFEANLQVGTTTFTDSVEHREVYYIKGVPDEIMKEILNILVSDYEEMTYGFIQWLTIFIRRCFELLGFENARSWNILWGWGVICSELIYQFLLYIARRMGWEDLLLYLERYNPNLFHPGDTKDVIDAFPQYFGTMPR